MFPLRMSHPQHGHTHAYDLTELEALRKAGWAEESKPVAAAIAVPKKLGRPRKAA